MFDRQALEALQELILTYPKVVAVFIPNALRITDYANEAERTALTDWYDPRKAKVMPHHSLRDQEKIRKDLIMKKFRTEELWNSFFIYAS